MSVKGPFVERALPSLFDSAVVLALGGEAFCEHLYPFLGLTRVEKIQSRKAFKPTVPPPSGKADIAFLEKLRKVLHQTVES